MLQKDFDNKISTLLGLKENVDVVPPQGTTTSPPMFPINTIPEPAPQQDINVAELLKKQTELIELIKAQNELIQKLLETKQTPPPPTQQIQQGGFVEKIINLKFDERGNPIGAEILAKPSVEDTLDLEDLEAQAHLALKIDLPTTEENN